VTPQLFWIGILLLVGDHLLQTLEHLLDQVGCQCLDVVEDLESMTNLYEVMNVWNSVHYGSGWWMQQDLEIPYDYNLSVQESC